MRLAAPRARPRPRALRQAAALALARRGVRRSAPTATPSSTPGGLSRQASKSGWGQRRMALLDGVELLVKSPGVPGESPLVGSRARAGHSGLERGRARLPAAAQPVRRRHRHERQDDDERAARRDLPRCRPAGRGRRQRRPAADELDGALAAEAWVVCELSSFQLEDVHDFKPRVAVLLNLEPDHLDRHGTFDAYRDAKLRIFENQTRGGRRGRARAASRPFPAARRAIEFRADDPLPAEPLIPGEHNRENAAAATAAARAAGIDDEAIAEALRTFPGVAAPARARRRDRRRSLRERLEGDEHRRRPARARRLRGEPLRLILGGSLQGRVRSTPLAADARPRTSASIDLIGEAADELAAALGRAGRLYRALGRSRHGRRCSRGARRSRATSSSSRPRARATTSSANFEERGEDVPPAGGESCR